MPQQMAHKVVTLKVVLPSKPISKHVTSKGEKEQVWLDYGILENGEIAFKKVTTKGQFYSTYYMGRKLLLLFWLLVCVY